MDKIERYYALMRTRDELQYPITIIFCSSDGPRNAHPGVKQEHTVQFSTNSRGLLITEDVVEFALKENLDALVGSMKYYIRQNLERACKEALQEAKNQFMSIEQELFQDDNNPT